MAFKVPSGLCASARPVLIAEQSKGAALDRSRGLRLRPAPVDIPLFLGARLCSLDFWFSLSCLSGRFGSCHRRSLRLCFFRCQAADVRAIVPSHACLVAISSGQWLTWRLRWSGWLRSRCNGTCRPTAHIGPVAPRQAGLITISSG